MSDDSLVPIYTVGYGKRTVQELIALLQQHDIAFLIDVRSKPFSRYQPDFNRRTLDAYLRDANIRYVFMGDTLGGLPDDPACYTDGKVDYEKVKQQPFYQAGIGRIQAAFQQQRRVVLMCSEGKPEMCHRTKLLSATLTSLNIPIAHIDEQAIIRTQPEVMHRLTAGQLTLFGEHTFTSRKRYQHDDE